MILLETSVSMEIIQSFKKNFGTYYILRLYLALEMERSIRNVSALVRGFGMVMNTILYLKGTANKDLFYSTWNSA